MTAAERIDEAVLDLIASEPGGYDADGIHAHFAAEGTRIKVEESLIRLHRAGSIEPRLEDDDTSAMPWISWVLA